MTRVSIIVLKVVRTLLAYTTFPKAILRKARFTLDNIFTCDYL